MKQLVYAMVFEGQATPTSDSGTALEAATRARSCTITSVVGNDGLAGTIRPAGGADARFESEVVFSSESDFSEAGTISFGDGNRLRFSTVGQGHLGPSADPDLKHGCVMWRIDGGEGQFEGATGLITSNFFVGGTGAVADHHFGVIFVR